MNRPLVVDVRHNTLDDGPGIRTAVFFKGCPLACVWCHNPEAISPDPELAFFRDQCIGCGVCAGLCKQGAATFEKGRGTSFDRSRCIACFSCVDGCPSGARRGSGRYMEVAELAAELITDLPFYRNSGGGVTLSGGEPAMFPDYASDLLAGLKSRGVHTLIETCGMFNLKAFTGKILPH
ncbi:MAG: glycyl-radical enzyme activating protein, partial [Myxococcota bacterium]